MQDKRSLVQDKRSITQDERGSAQDQRSVTQDERGSAQDKRSNTQDERGSAQDQRSLEQDERGLLHDLEELQTEHTQILDCNKTECIAMLEERESELLEEIRFGMERMKYKIGVIVKMRSSNMSKLKKWLKGGAATDVETNIK
jgi:hypothetical protein